MIGSVGDERKFWEEHLDRSILPDWYIPSATGGIVAGEDLLLRGGFSHPGRRRPPGWVSPNPGVFVKDFTFTERRYVIQNGYKKLWCVERQVLGQAGRGCEEVLTRMGQEVVFTRTYQEAMYLAELSLSDMLLKATGMSWEDNNRVEALRKLREAA